MKYAITPRGIAKKPGARAIDNAGSFLPGESFAVPEGGYDPALVLAEDAISLRTKTPEELAFDASQEAAAAVEQDAQTALLNDALSDAVFDQLKSATPAQIAGFVNTAFRPSPPSSAR